MPDSKKNILVAAAIFIAIAIDTFSRWFGSWELQVSKFFRFNSIPTWYNAWDVFDFCNISALILIAYTCWILSEKRNKAVGMFVTILMASLMYDKLYGVQRHIRVDDIIWWIMAVLIPAAYIFFTSEKVNIDRPVIVLISAGLLKIVTDNIHFEFHFLGVDRTVFEMGNATSHFVFAIYIAQMTYRKYTSYSLNILNTFLPILLFAATFNDARDNNFGNPYDFQWKELMLMALVLITMVWWVLKEKYAQTPQSRKQYNQVIIAVNIFIVVARYILLN